MRVIEFFTAENKEHWLEELKKCDWDAGQYLHHLLKGNELKKMVGETALVPMLVDEERLLYTGQRRGSCKQSTGIVYQKAWKRGFS